MRKFGTEIQYIGTGWMARCEELRITLEEGSFDALIVRMKMAIQETAELELNHIGDIELKITMKERIDILKAVG